MSTFAIGESDFLLDGSPHQILSGALHYFRIHPDHWADRIRKARLLGLNAVETYVAWNAHEPVQGEWDETGWNDLGRFLDLIEAEGLHAIVRPGPYICAEWHNGGLPVWLTNTPGIAIRTSEPQYLEAVTEYLQRVCQIVAPRQIDRGGSVILMQVENEYGAYGADKDYLRSLVDTMRGSGIVVPLTTVDSPEPQMLADGGLPDVLRTGSFGGRALERLASVRRFQPTGPLMCSEFWNGWFDWWGGIHHTTSADASAAELDAMLAAGASVNLYMLHGGTNFGTTNGANDKGRYTPTLTSYDYDAPLDEAGYPTEKFHAFRRVIEKYAPVPTEVPEERTPAPTFTVELSACGDWLPGSALSVTAAEQPQTFEQVGHLGPLVRYDVDLPESAVGGEAAVLAFTEVRDMAWVSVDGVAIGRLSRGQHERALTIPPGRRLSVLVEDQGRVNYDHRLGESKGLIGAVELAGVPLKGWRSTAIDIDEIAASVTPRSGSRAAGRSAWRGVFDLTRASDLYLDTARWGKGFVYINGFLLGRYWVNGPQRTLFVPGPITREGANDIVVLELDQVLEQYAAFVGEPMLGNTD